MANYIYKVGTSKQASDYVIITRYLINHIRKSFEFGDDIGQALDTRTEFMVPRPTLQQSTATVDTDKERENKEHQFVLASSS